MKRKYSLELTGKLVDGTPILIEGDDMVVGSRVFVITETGEKLPAPDGSHIIDGGPEFVTVDGIISEIKTDEPNVEVEVKPEVAVENTTNLESEIKKLSEEILKMKAEFEIKLSEIVKVEKVEVELPKTKLSFREEIISKLI